jgi:hypothetical protein
VVSSNAVAGALARSRERELVEPVESSVVDGFGDVETEVKSAVIAASQYKHELARLVLHFAYL